MNLERYRRLVSLSGLYDLVVSLPFATPWTAALTLEALSAAHHALHLGGSSVPPFLPIHMLFVSFFGTVVTLWSLVRIKYRRPVDGALDAVGRGFFSTWMIWGLAHGASRVLFGFLVLELGFGVAQGVGFWRLGRETA